MAMLVCSAKKSGLLLRQGGMKWRAWKWLWKDQLTRQRNGENGRARSRAKAYIWREVVATLLSVLQRLMTMMRQVMAVVPLFEPVAL